MTVPNNRFPALSHTVDPVVLRSIRQASAASSADFGLLMAQAARESGFRPDAKSTTSSAAGLFQFVDSTWLDMVHRFGAKYGVGDLAREISQSDSGKLVVANTSARQKILDLRQNPTLSAELAGEYAKQNQATLEQAVGRPLSRGDLYMAHFLGAGGASEFLKALDSKGNTIAAKLLPDAAAANPSVFYDASGRAKTVSEIYQAVATKIEQDASAFAGTTADPAPGASPAAMNFARSTGLAFGGTSSLGSGTEWSGMKLSPPVLAMLNVVALAALKMSEDTSPPRAATNAAAPHSNLRPPHSI